MILIFAKLVNKYYQRIRIRIYKSLSEKVDIEGRPQVNQPVLMIGQGKIRFGQKVTLGHFPSPFFYNGVIHLEARQKKAKIVFGNNIYSNNNLSIICEGSLIEIGDDVLIGTNVEIIDSDFHNLDPNLRNSGDHKCRPVIIGRNVFVGSNVKILKGVTIGENSVIASSSVVVKDIPANVIVAGNPASVIKEI